jgi:hypothetical protein
LVTHGFATFATFATFLPLLEKVASKQVEKSGVKTSGKKWRQKTKSRTKNIL